MPIIDMKETGRNIKKMMKQNGISVKDMQDVFGLTEQAIYKWMQGKSLPSIDNMVLIAKTFNVKIDDIIIIRY